MEKIYQGFDKLEVSFQGKLPENILKQLRDAKEEAQKNDAPVRVTIGNPCLDAYVRDKGANGGYAFCLDTGADGELWFIKDSNDATKHNIRVSVTSLSLALNGYDYVKNKLYDVLDRLDATGANTYNPDTAKASTAVVESVARVDYCFDFIDSGDFEPAQKHILAHNQSTVTSVSRGSKMETVTVGMMPSRQMSIYNKTKEIIKSQKRYWWQLWGIKQDTFSGNVWRVEVRAGKEELLKWHIKTFDDLEAKMGDVFLDILKSSRYVRPSNDSNVSRWPNEAFWDVCISGIREMLEPYISNTTRGSIYGALLQDKKADYMNQVTGNFLGLLYLKNNDPSSYKETFSEVLDEILDTFESCPKRIDKKFKELSEKFYLINKAATEGACHV